MAPTAHAFGVAGRRIAGRDLDGADIGHSLTRHPEPLTTQNDGGIRFTVVHVDNRPAGPPEAASWTVWH